MPCTVLKEFTLAGRAYAVGEVLTSATPWTATLVRKGYLRDDGGTKTEAVAPTEPTAPTETAVETPDQEGRHALRRGRRSE